MTMNGTHVNGAAPYEEFVDDFEEELEPEALSIEQLQSEAPRATDSANADAFIAEHGRGYLFVVEWDSWIAWNGKRWDRLGARSRVVNAAMLTSRAEYARTLGLIRKLEKQLKPLLLEPLRDADKIADIETSLKHYGRLLKWHEQSQNMSRLDAVAKVLQTRLVVSLSQLDRNPWLLNVANGTVDLRTADLHPHLPEDLITQITDVEWDPYATCPTWTAFVSTVMGGKLELVLYLQRLIGYSMTALTSEHLLAFFYGGGRNGKSTFLQTIRTVLGEYSCAAPRDLLFEDRSGQRHPAELARLYGKRLAVCAEIGEYTVLDEAKVKDLTGGDSVSVRRMREDFWDLEPTHTLFVAGNHKPRVPGDDLGIWRRIRLIPWTVTIAEDDVDKDLGVKLKGELSGILRWGVLGCIEWQANGLVEPQAVLDATADYRAESDVLGEFLSKYVVFEADARITRQALRERYQAWCEESGHVPLGARKIAQRLREKDVTDASVREGMKVKDGWAGVRLKTDYELSRHAEPDSRNAVS